MADYYQQFSVMITPLKRVDEQARAWFERVVEAIVNGDYANKRELPDTLDPDVVELLKCLVDNTDFCDMDCRNSEGIWLYSEMSCDLNAVTRVLMLYLRKFDPEGEVVIEYADTCSKMRTDGFGGGWVLVRADKILWSPQPDEYETLLANQKDLT